tara:strand:+ start:51864 stop:52607 length:744 start_codon:yes stop_codon:yes gene_type:complete
MKIDFSNKTILITGGTRGIGFGILKLLQKKNASIITTGTNVNEIKKLNQNSKGKKIKYFYLDFTDADSINNFLNKISELKKIDILINNAGVNKIDRIDKINENDWDLINNVNLKGPFLLTREVSKIMKKNHSGKILNIASIFSTVSKQKRATYSATKWGIIGFTKAIALDLAPDNILVNAVSPGFVDTELTRKILGNEGIKEIKNSIPQKRLANVEEIANTILFLVSDYNTYITGQNLIIDGGFTSA